MIAGRVNARFEAVFEIEFQGWRSAFQTIGATLDTGFSGSLTVPPAIDLSLKLIPFDETELELADGSLVTFDRSRVLVIWDGRPQIVTAVGCGTRSLIGTTLVDGFELNFPFRAGATVTLTALP